MNPPPVPAPPGAAGSPPHGPPQTTPDAPRATRQPRLAWGMAARGPAGGGRVTRAGTFLRRNFEPLILSIQVVIDLLVVVVACLAAWWLRESLAGPNTKRSAETLK